ncbi:Unknown protein [Striga hermonthica]|uniref:CCHC-type domain-containing protein n=1 Tax=Striga hermonthica TaxID=68872 RepID=A0A9N7N975_STRHE|nr:Unknown protein [Striga hermonthica]
MSDWTDADLRKMQYDVAAINMLHCALDAAEYNRISGCESAKEIWEKFETTYEGTDKVKESKINQQLRYYELFEMKEGESIGEMNNRFVNIINKLKRLGKSFTEEEQVKKILRSLPRSWEAKKTAIEEAHDLKSYKFDELIGSLLTHEISVRNFDEKEKQGRSDDKKQKAIVLKADSSEDEGSDEDDMAIVARKLKRMFKKGRRFHNRRYKNFSTKKDLKKDEEPSITCFECHQLGHIRTSCPKLRKDKKFKKKKAMVATSSDSEESESSSSSDEEENTETANICFMAHDGEHTEEVSSDTSDESESEADRDADPQEQVLSMSTSEMHCALFALYQFAKKSAAKMKRFQRRIVELEEDRSFHEEQFKNLATTLPDHEEKLKLQGEDIQTITQECANLREWIEEFQKFQSQKESKTAQQKSQPQNTQRSKHTERHNQYVKNQRHRQYGQNRRPQRQSVWTE